MNLILFGIGGNSDFQIPGQSLVKKNCNNSRTSHDIDMKPGPVINHDKRNTVSSKEIEHDVMLANCDFIVIFLIYGQFEAIWKPDFGWMVCKTYIFININVLSYKK